mgnify:CR=1 FL=1
MMSNGRRSRRRAVGLAEVAMASLLLGVLLIGALNSVGARLRHQALLADHQQAHRLAEQLLAEVLEHRYADPDATPVFGPETSESGGTRSVFDDVDDFDGWDQTGPVDRDGAALANVALWRRTVGVAYVPTDDMTGSSGSDQGLKRITVNVYHGGQLIVSRVGIRSNAWEDMNVND